MIISLELTFSKIKTHSATQRQVKTEGGRGFVGEGIEVQINGRELAVFCVNDKLYCIDEKCPHAGKGGREGRGRVIHFDVYRWTASSR